MTSTRRNILGVGLTSAAGLLAVAVTPAEAHTGVLTNDQVKKLALEPKAPADFKRLAEHFKALKTDAEKESALYEAIAKSYRKGITVTSQGQGHDAARALEHVAEHARDSAEALDHLVETFDALAENFKA